MSPRFNSHSTSQESEEESDLVIDFNESQAREMEIHQDICFPAPSETQTLQRNNAYAEESISRAAKVFAAF